MFPTRIRVLAAIAGLAALTGALMPLAASAAVPSNQVPESLKTAIQAEIESKGHKYAGFCVDVQGPGQTPPYGEYCSFVLSIEHDIAEVTYGPVATNDITRVNFHNDDGSWTKMTGNPAPIENAPLPPNTGTGNLTNSDDDSSATLVVMAALALAVAATAVSGVAVARRR